MSYTTYTHSIFIQIILIINFFMDLNLIVKIWNVKKLFALYIVLLAFPIKNNMQGRGGQMHFNPIFNQT